MRTSVPFRNRLQLAARGDAKNAVKIQLPRILLISEGRIGEIHVPVAPHDDIAGSVQALPVVARGQHVEFAVPGHSRDPALAEFAGVEPSLVVVGVAIDAAGAAREFRDPFARSPFFNPVRHRVTEQQKSFQRPHRALRVMHFAGDRLHANVGEVLRKSGARQQDRKMPKHSSHYAAPANLPERICDRYSTDQACYSNPANKAAIRCAVFPSHRGGHFGSGIWLSFRRAALTMASHRLATNSLVPVQMVTGRSVLARAVRQGTPKKVVSSCIPPESVSTSEALRSSARKSR